MSSALAPHPVVRPGPVALRRFGYAAAIVVNAVLLWVVHQLLGWAWPGFLAADFEQVLPMLTASLVASMAANAVFLLRDRGRVRALGDLVTSAFAVAVGWRTWTVFPFDFTGYARDWTGLTEVLVVVVTVATAIAVVVNLVQLVTGRAGPED